MSNSQPAGSRLLRGLLQVASPSTQGIFANAHLNTVQPSPGINDVPAVLPVTPAEPEVELDDATKIALFDEVLEEIKPDNQDLPEQVTLTPSVLDQAVPVAVQQQTSEEPPQGGGKQKEQLEGGSLPVATLELPGGMQQVEQEKAPEIPPEVESYIQHVEEQAKVEPQTVVIAQELKNLEQNQPQPPRIVKVLPLTKAQEEVGMHKNPTFSIRWLVEFGHKIAKMFSGGVVYRQEG